MHADFKGWLITCGLVVAIVLLKGCTTKEYIPVLKNGELSNVAPELVAPAKRPPSRVPDDTPVTEGSRQWAQDRKDWGDEADRSDTKSRLLCAERGGRIINPKTGKNVCDLLKR